MFDKFAFRITLTVFLLQGLCKIVVYLVRCFVVIIRMRSYMIILYICKFFNGCVKLVLCAMIMLINKGIFQCIDIFFIGELPYGYPILLMLKVIPRFLQNFANSFVVH